MPSKQSPLDPDILFTSWSQSPTPPNSARSFASAIQCAFSLPSSDSYIYHAAPTSLSLSQAQSALNAGGANNLHAWYRDIRTGEPHPPPPQADIEAYIRYFDPSTNPSKALTALKSNAKRGSIRAAVANRLQELRILPEEDDGATGFKFARRKGFINPAGDFWAFCCRELEWAGPISQERDAESDSQTPGSAGKEQEVGQEAPQLKLSPQSHHVVPVLMHHFGCVIPSWECISLLVHTAAGRPIYDIGSGNGYWSYVLRREGADITPVDDGQSEWRTMWVQDTVREDGARFLKRKEGGKGGVLLMVYPVTAGGFVENVVDAYKEDTVVVVGTMNRNGYTGFRDRKVGEWMLEKGWKVKARVPLPSFAGKDEGMEVFVR